MKKDKFGTGTYAENAPMIAITSTGTSYSALGSWEEMQKEIAELKERVSALEKKAELQKLIAEGPTEPEAHRETEKCVSSRELNEILDRLEVITHRLKPHKKWYQFWK